MMTWNDPSLMIILVSTLILTFSFLMLYFTNEKQKYLLVWAAAWGGHFLRTLFLSAGSSGENYEIFAVPAAEIISVINSYLILYGMHIYDDKKINRGWLVLSCMTAIWIIFIPFATTDFIVKTTPPSIVLFTFYSYAGYMFIKGVKNPAFERITTGIFLLLWAIHRLDFPLLWPDERYRLAGYLTGATLNIIIAFFVLVTYLQDTRRRYISEKLKAEEADRLKSSFLANMSHEIRTPLNAILGFTQLLSKPELSSDDKEIFIKNIKSSGEKLLSLLDDVLDLSKIEAGVMKIYLSDVPINRLIDELISVTSLSGKIVEKRISLVHKKFFYDGEDIIRTDETRLFQIISNLLQNAVKYSESGTVTIGYEIFDQDYLRFFVKDTGIGISEEFYGKIFTPFFQEGKTPGPISGTGLGLPIAKGLTESLGGRIWVKSSKDEGTEVSFTIPYIKGAGAKQIKSFSASADSYKITGKKILLVEDEPVNRRLIEKFIESTGADLISTASGNESVRFCLTDRKIDLVLMDLSLPDLDGYSAIAEIKKERPELPVVVQSANAMPEHRDRAKIAGADAFISKPIKKEELYNAIWTQLFGRDGN